MGIASTWSNRTPFNRHIDELTTACDFAENGGICGIGRLVDAVAILEGKAGTPVSADA